jgi:hypothetical protein
MRRKRRADVTTTKSAPFSVCASCQWRGSGTSADRTRSENAIQAMDTIAYAAAIRGGAEGDRRHHREMVAAGRAGLTPCV